MGVNILGEWYMKVLFVIHHLKVGGVQKSLLNITSELLKKNFEITFMVLLPKGDLMEEIPKGIDVIVPSTLNQYFIEIFYKSFFSIIKTKNPLKIIIKLFFSLLNKLGLKLLLSKLLIHKLRVQESYKHIISYEGIPGLCDQVILNKKIPAKKITWIHGDPTRFSLDIKKVEQYYSAFDAIALVSNSNLNKFKLEFPRLSNKCFLVYNAYNISKLRKLASEVNPYISAENTIFVTVARMDNSSKRIDRIIEVCRRLVDDQYSKFCWYLVGEGPDLKKFKELVSKYHLEKKILFVGNKSNPYPYMKNADFFVLSSDFEGYGMALREAIILGTPGIAVSFDSAKEVITNNYSGIIVPKTTNGLYNGIVKVLDDLNLCVEYRNNIKEESFNNNLPITQFKKLLNSDTYI